MQNHEAFPLHMTPDDDTWPLQDRVKFLPWVKSKFQYDVNGVNDSDEARALFVQQKFVRDYLQRASPYRGLVLVHSLGVGKTCAAIATAEALRPSARQIYVMTTKMLKGSFIGEVPSCIAPDLLRRQRWTLVSPSHPSASTILDKIPNKMLKANGGVWVAGEETGVEYDDMDTSSQHAIDAQIEGIVSSSFHFVHYNGLSRERVRREFMGDANPFDHSVVIIDEVHNFISRVMNQRLVKPIYDRLLDAVDCKVILLSGTPIVNRAAELAYIVNLVQGKTIVHNVMLRNETSQEVVDDALAGNLKVQTAYYDPGSRLVRVVLTPFGFDMAGPGVVKRSPAQEQGIDAVVALLNRNNVKVSSTTSYAVTPLPDDVDVFDAHFIDWEHGAVINPMLLQRRIIGAISSYRKQDRANFASVSDINVVHADLSGIQFIKYAQLRYEERRRERNAQRMKARAGRGKVSGEVSMGQVYRTFSMALCTFAFPDEINRPFRFQMRQRLKEESDAEIDNDKVDRDYEASLELATKRLRTEMPSCLRVDGSLNIHSPKFLALLERLEASHGSALVYSQFRRAEGIGLLSATMEENGWEELYLVKLNGSWVVPKRQTQEVRKRYIILKTDDDPECNRLLRHVFNNELDQLPTATRDSLPGDTNLHGELARVYMISASGAEGISLKNVRQVHMLEAYWNHNRLDQVIGRAVRARSHIDLPESERHVDVFLYLSNLTDDQRTDHTIMHLDKGLTSDQYLHAVAMKKKHLTDQVLALIRGASVDCMVHADSEHEKNTCFHLPNGLNEDEVFRTPDFVNDLDDVSYAKRMTKLVVVRVDGVRYYMDKANGILYDYEMLRNNVLSKVGQVQV